VNKTKEIKTDLTKVKMTVSLSPGKDEVVVSPRMRSSTSQMNWHAGPAKNVLQSLEDSFHIISDSEEEALEAQSNNNARAQRTGAEKGLLPGKNGQQSAVNLHDAQMTVLISAHQHVATSTPLRKMTTPFTFISSLPSSLTPSVCLSSQNERQRFTGC
jgi:hypothetical protein